MTGDYSKKEYEDECKQAENFLSNALKKYVDEEFVQAYGKILMDGLHRLNVSDWLNWFALIILW